MEFAVFFEKVQHFFAFIFGKVFSFFDKILYLLKAYYDFMKCNNSLECNISLIAFIGSCVSAILYNSIKIDFFETCTYCFLAILLLHIILTTLYVFSNSVFLSIIFLLFINSMVSTLTFYYIIEKDEDYGLNGYLIFILYCCIWTLYSFLANSKVSKLANEVIAGIFTFIYTIISFYLSILSDDQILQLAKYYNNGKYDHGIQDYEARIRMGYSFVKDLQKASGILLVIVGLSAFFVVIIGLRIYWEEKYRDKVIEQ